jgi:hypothetical protein
VSDKPARRAVVGEIVTRSTQNNGPPNEAFAYTNRQDVAYYLHEGKTKTGKVRYYFARSVEEGALAELPAGWEVSESINGVVSVRRRREGDVRIPADDLLRVQAEMRRHPHLRHHVAQVDRDAIVIYQPDVDLAELREIAASAMVPGRAEAFVEDRIRRARFSPVLRFVRDDSTYVVQRMTYRGDGGWSYPLALGALDRLMRDLVPKIGTDEFFELM